MEFNHAELENTETAVNLVKAFASETQARVKLAYYADKARKEGFAGIAFILNETADDDKAHAELEYDILCESLKPGTFKTETSVSLAYGTTPQNLAAAAKGKYELATKTYPLFAEAAKKEGLSHISEIFSNLASIESRNGMRIHNYFERYKKGMLYKLNYDANWKCLNCGFVVHGREAPEVCPVCHYPQSYYIILIPI